MACALTQGFTLDCRSGVGGIKEVYIMEVGNVTSYTESSGVITAITKVTGKRFWKYAQVRETSTADETITGSEQNGTIFYAQKVDVVFTKRTVNARNEIMLLAQNHVVIVAIDNTGAGWLYGRVQGLMLNAGSAPQGTAWGDRNGYVLNFTGNEVELAPQVDAATIATLQTPG